MMEKGVIVCLTASTSEICNRLAHSTNRPLIKVKNPAKKIASLIDTRRHWYKICDHEIDTTQLLLEDVVEKILAIVTGKYRILPL